jgi:hypothetical protein
MRKEQRHPLAHIDRQIVKSFFMEGMSDFNLTELARLKIRYHNFPGATDIQFDLVDIMNQWELTEDQLYEKTRLFYAKGKFSSFDSENEEDWS